MSQKIVGPAISVEPIDNFVPQQANANGHTERGTAMLERSIGQRGWIGAITVAADGEVFDGSARLEAIATQLPGNAVVIESDGTVPVIVKRTDIPTATDPKAIALAIDANRVAEVNLNWVPEALVEAHESGSVDVYQWWTEAEFNSLLKGVEWSAEPEGSDQPMGDRDAEKECKCPNCGHQFIQKL